MVPFVVAGVVGLAALVSGCGSKEEKEPNADSDPIAEPIKLTLYQSGKNLWYDGDADGKEIPQELTLFSSKDDEAALIRLAKKFIQERPYFQPPCNMPWQVEVLPNRKWESPQGKAQKRLMTRRLAEDLKTIKKIDVAERPVWMQKLWQDLNLMAQELPFLKFRKASRGEVPDGFLAVYDDGAGELIYGDNTPMSLMVHEFDHAITARRRVEPWAIANKVKCPDGSVIQFPMTPYRQTHDQVRTSFKFYVNLENRKDEMLTYDSWQYWQPMLYGIEHGRDKCLSPQEKAAPLADETHAYLVMVRYLLFQMMTDQDIKLTQSQIEAAGKGNPTAQRKIEQGLKKVFRGTSLNHQWAKPLVIAALQDTYGNQDGQLKNYVRNYYAGQSQPGFVDPPNCVAD